MSLALTGAHIVTPDAEIKPGVVVIEDGIIVDAGPNVRPPAGAAVTELPDTILAPGFIDIHVHGGGSFSLATVDTEVIRSYARWVVARGVTSFLATVVAEKTDGSEALLHTVAQTSGPVTAGANLLGAHLEGPFVNPVRRGALPPGWLHAPDVGLMRRYLEAAGGHLRLLTLAPELPGAPAVLEEALSAGCVVALGHTDASYERAREACDAGARHLTHTFNAMRPFHHREPGVLAAALEHADVTVELIADGVHVHPAAARLLLSAKGVANVALITDGVPTAGSSGETFRLGGQEARLSAGRMTLADGTIAGSVATMDTVVRNIVREWGLAPLAEAIRMASTVPARVLGLDSRKGRIAPGYDADLISLDEELHVLQTWVAGEVVYVRPEGAVE